MKNKILFLVGTIFFFCFYSNLNAQKDFPKNGTAIVKDADGKIVLQGTMKNGKYEGEWKTFDSDGSLRSIYYYSKGQRNGTCYEFNKGDTAKIQTYKNDSLDGISKEFSLKGKLVCLSHYCNGELCDTMILYEGNNVAWDFIPFQNGKKEGLERTFSNGHLTHVTSWHDNLKNGKHFVQTETGRLIFEEWYSSDILDSATFYFDVENPGVESKIVRIKSDTLFYLYHAWQYSKKGTLVSEFHIVRPLVDRSYFEGEYKSFYENGKIKSSYNYHYNEIQGKYSKWNQNGILVLQGNCSKNVLKDSIQVWDDAGKSLELGTEEFDKSVVKNMEVGMEFRGRFVQKSEPFPTTLYYKNDSTGNFEDCKVYSFAEVMPEFVGGSEAFNLYLAKHIQYPEVERESGKTGTVYISFIVTRTGKVVNVKAVKEVPGAPGFTKEALRVFASMPDWNFGVANGKPVNVTMVQPVRFVLQ